MDLWKKPALKLIVEVVWTADCQSDTHTSLWRAHTHAHAALTHPSQQIMCSLLLITPCGLIHSIYRFRFPRRVVFIFSLRVQKPDLICEKLLLRALKHSWTHVAYRFRFLSFGSTI